MIKIGVIGTGGMAHHHASQFQGIKGVRLTACCDASQERAKAFAAKFGVGAVYTNYHTMLEQEELDGVTNVTPDAVHAEVALAVLRKHVAILSEKPMARTLAEAKRMAAAAKKAGVINMINFSYRNSSALQHAALEVRKGLIGNIRHVEASYLQSWLVNKAWGDWRKSPSLTWRLSTRHGSAGVLGDLGCHIYDMMTLLCGDVAQLSCRLGTFDKGVRGNKLGAFVLDANDSFVSHVVLKNGALGVVHSSRWAIGHANSLRVRVYGDEGAVEVDLDRSYDEYRICAGRKAIHSFAWKTVKCKPTPSMYQRFVTAIRTGRNDASDFENGLKIQAYLHFSFKSSDAGRPMRIVP